ncbi:MULTISPECIES: glutamate racemase [Paenibacillus]|nr:glutamate racemase [Paenibacillus assamensis]
MQQAIAMFDSGVGGLTVVKEVMRQLPREKIIYFGDTARTPYGPRDADEVRLFTRQIVDYLAQFDPKMIVIACNTATAVALEEVRSYTTVPVVGVIHPGARAAISASQSGHIGVIGTDGTIRSAAYESALKRLSPHVKVYSLACPLLVPLVEKGMFRDSSTYRIVADSLEPLKSTPIDTLILGCTHYPFLTDPVQEVVGSHIQLINSAEETAREISTILHDKGQLAHEEDHPIHQMFCSGDPSMFQYIAKQWLGDQLESIPVVWQVPNFY